MVHAGSFHPHWHVQYIDSACFVTRTEENCLFCDPRSPILSYKVSKGKEKTIFRYPISSVGKPFV